MDNYALLRTLYLGVLEHTPFLVNCASNLVCFEEYFL